MIAAPFPIVIKVWVGREPHELRYLRYSLTSLFKSSLPEEAHVILIDDCSTDGRARRLLSIWADRQARVEIWKNPERLGPNKGQERHFPEVVRRFPDAEYYVLCDDDIIYHPGWLGRLMRVYEEAKQAGLEGVFTGLNVPIRPSFRSVRLPTSRVLLKERQAALNWLLPRKVYEVVGPFRDKGVAYDTDYCDRLRALQLPVICLQPSYVQNIGYQGAYQQDDTYTARDFVGQKNLSLLFWDFWYGMRRMSGQATRSIFERLPDGRLKHSARKVSQFLRR